MFKSPTVLVLGSGSSAEVNLPVGEKLALDIAQLMNVYFQDGYKISGSGDHSIYELLTSTFGIGSNQALRAMWSIKDGITLADSIDTFLHRHRADEAVIAAGKLGILKSIIRSKKNSYLVDAIETYRGEKELDFLKISNTWFVRFFRIISSDIEVANVGSIFSNLTVINFNYDRCLERFLLRALVNGYRLNFSQAEEVLSGLKIIHPYGMVSTKSASFGKDLYYDLSTLESIKTFTEQVNSDDSKLIKNAVGAAKTMIFLGFAFHQPNMAMLTVDRIANIENVYATVFGTSKADRQSIESSINGVFHKRNKQLNIDLQPLKCADFLQEYHRTLSNM